MKAAQAALLVRALANGAATAGNYHEGTGDKQSTFVTNYSY